MRFTKKGSLELSIQSIVIVVIAFIVLGLGLGFVQNIFDQGEGLTDTAFKGTADKLKTSIAKSNDPLYFPQDTLSLERGQEKVDGVGVKNVGDVPAEFSVRFSVRVNSQNNQFVAFEPGQVQTFGSADSAFTAGMDWDSTAHSLGPGQGEPFPFSMTAPDKFGSYLYKVEVMKGADPKPYASKTFFVKVG
ncbi:hypothetical protein HYV86_02225 [Candidatus Woesearchaeota archaeon]|nr:hypothetical protein [Candidatus Woesearchaeota archaeon]